jgi:Ku protein
MKDKKRVALARIVMANREHVIAIEAFDRGMLGTTLRYDYEVRDAKDYLGKIPQPRLDRQMVGLASHILGKKAGHFDPSKFKDEYETALKRLVKRKAAGHTIEREEEPQRESNVIDLMDALKQSMKAGRRSGRRTKSSSQRSKSTSHKRRAG